MRNDIPQTVDNVVYPNLKSVAKAFNMPETTIYKRYQRGKRGNDLVPAKCRKDYIAPTPKPKVSRVTREFMAGGFKYKSAADACRKLNVSYGAYHKRIRSGDTPEEALGLVQRTDKRTIKHESKKRNRRNSNEPLIAFGKEYKSYTELEKAFGIKSYVLSQRVNKYGKTLEEAILMEGKSKKIKIGDVEFDTKAEFAKAIGINPNNFYQLSKKYSIEQILGIEDRTTANSVVYRGKWYPSQIALAADFGLTANEYYYRIHDCKLSLDEALSIPSKASIVESFGDEGKLYIADIGHTEKNGTKLYKIGVTQHNLDTRYTGFPFTCKTVLSKKGKITYLREVEKKIKSIYKDKNYNDFTAKDFDGFSEVYQLSNSEINKLKLLIRFDNVGLNQAKEGIEMTVEA